MKSIIGRKAGMTQVFATDGTAIPVTVVEVLPNVVVQKKTIEKDGYNAIQIGYEEVEERKVSKPEAGHFAKAGVKPMKFVKETRADEMQNYNVGDIIDINLFNVGDIVDVTGTSKGKGFAGVIAAYGYHIGPRAHGSGYHRGIGSLATNGRTNNRIHPGRKMPGHHGNEGKTILNLTVVAVMPEKNALLVKGAIPGAKTGLVTVRSAVKTQRTARTAKTLVDYTAAAAE